jgi:hypothetical protein
MTVIPTTPEGKQLYPYDTRNFRAKLLMWFWKRFGSKIKYQTFMGETITGERTRYYGCLFSNCRFEDLTLVFIERCIIEYGGDMPRFTNMNMCEIRDCIFRRPDPMA